MSLTAPLIVETNALAIREPMEIHDIGAMSPDVAVSPEGTAWVAWSQMGDAAGERICARRFDGMRPGPVLEVSTRAGVELQPCIVHDASGTICMVWVAHRDAAWHLLTRRLDGPTLGPETIIASSTDGLFKPRAALDAEGTLWVVCERVVGPNTELALHRETNGSWEPSPIKTLPGDGYRPDLCLGPDNALWLAYDAYSSEGEAPPTYRVAIQPVGTRQLEDHFPLVVADSGYQNLHASLASDADGRLWIGLASNRNEARRDPAWLTKWSTLYCFDGTELTEPVGPRPDVDLYNEHAYQGWEFPAVGVGGDGSVVLFGQSAHSVLAQRASSDGWGNAHTIVDRTWGSWKPQCRVAGSDPMVLVSMGLGGAQIQWISCTGPGDASPMLAPASSPLPALPENSAVWGDPTNARARADRPTVRASDGTEYGIYFGDLHAHSIYSDAVGDVDEFYHRYRDLYGYDFAALTDHDYLDGIELSASELKMIWNHADRMTEPGSFLAWYAYEWTSPAISVHAAEGAAVGEGHRHVLYPDQTGPLVRYGAPESNTGAKLLEKLKGHRALVIPHHTSWSGTDWDAHDPELQRVVEIVSTHGRFEYPGNQPIGYRRDHIHTEKTVLDALNRGYKLGFVGGSDSHGLRWHAIELEGRAAHIPHGTRVGTKEDAYRTGMTAILSRQLDREHLFEAVYERRCYATSGVPIVLDFRVDAALMGSELTVEGSPTISVRVEGTGPLRAVEVIRSGHVFSGLQMQPGEGIPEVSFELVDTMLIPGEEAYYYLRVTQEDGNMAWSSPIWVRYQST
ncbi:MAG: hypothetical protein Rubg2KO_38020 [Rubricoccaceae bacterium]